MKKKLGKYFGDGINLTKINGASHVVTFHTMVANTLNDFRRKQLEQPKDTITHIIKIAAKLIKNDIKLIQQSLEM